MLGMPGPLGTIIDLLAVMLGFGAIIFIHELGHFLAARWAGIRVLTFAVGFGPALFSFRRGIGFRKGSTHDEYNQRLQDPALAAASPTQRNKEISHTEYRLSALPFGGYVQMLGQDDLDPTSVSNDNDSYQNAPVWKRMIVISAGVVMNIILAAVLFIIVFNAGLSVQPPIVGRVLENAPAQTAAYLGNDPTITPGLQPRDRIISIDGFAPKRLDSVILKAAMSKTGTALPITIQRDDKILNFSINTEKSDFSGLLDIGIAPQYSTKIVDPKDSESQKSIESELARNGLEALRPGDTIAAINGVPTPDLLALETAFENSDGSPMILTIERDQAAREITANPVATLQTAIVHLTDSQSAGYKHLLGLTPIMTVAEFGDAPKQGLEHGDIFKRIGSIEFPSYAAGLKEVRAHTGKPIELVVLRKDQAGSLKPITINAKVSRKGMVGFSPDTTANTSALLAAPPASIIPLDDSEPQPAPAAQWLTRAGARILSINGQPVGNFQDIRAALKAAIASTDPAVSIEYDFPYSQIDHTPHTANWTLNQRDAAEIAALGWTSPIQPYFFMPTETILKADGPLQAISFGLDETKRVMASVYVTFLRLSQGSLPVDKINGPVGIAHIGTAIADRGFIWILFFLGMISVNLAVVNFLPLPIVDGGQFLMLLYEGIRGKPVPIAVQSVVMTAGLILIATAFIFVTFNDIKGLLGV